MTEDTPEWLELIELARQASVRPVYEPALDVLTDRLLELGLIKPLFHSPKNKKRVQRQLRRDALKWADAVHPPRLQWGIYVNGVLLELGYDTETAVLGYYTETAALSPGRLRVSQIDEPSRTRAYRGERSTLRWP
jgi:hypothetical protein